MIFSDEVVFVKTSIAFTTLWLKTRLYNFELFLSVYKLAEVFWSFERNLFLDFVPFVDALPN